MGLGIMAEDPPRVKRSGGGLIALAVIIVGVLAILWHWIGGVLGSRS